MKSIAPWCFGTLYVLLGCGGRMDADVGGVASGGAIPSFGGAVNSPPTAPGGSSSTTYPGSGGNTYSATSTYLGAGGAYVTTYLGAGGAYTTTYFASGGASTGTISPAYCNSSMNLVALAAQSSGSNWVGGDPLSTSDNPCGVQGAIYAFSDTGLDNIDGTADDTVQYPPMDPAGSGRQSPCGGSWCCVSGRTSNWPIVGYSPDYQAGVWGGGIGLHLNDPGNGELHQPYAGPAMGFVLTLQGTLNGQALRVAYTQSPYDDSPPFVQVATLGKVTVLFSSVTCPPWGSTCISPSRNPYDLQLHVVGGDVAGDYKVCIQDITPYLPILL